MRDVYSFVGYISPPIDVLPVKVVEKIFQEALSGDSLRSI